MKSNKKPICKICGGPHYKTFCFRAERKPMATRKPLQARRTPIKASTTIRTHKPKKPLKRSHIASKSKRERSVLVNRLDRVFSIYIRRKDSIGGIARCVTCGNAAPWRGMQNGHFISRRKMTLRWDEKNCHVQCKHCNETLHGNLAKYEAYIIRKYGIDVVFYLRQKANQTEKIQMYEIEEMIKLYEKKVAELPPEVK